MIASLNVPFLIGSVVVCILLWLFLAFILAIPYSSRLAQVRQRPEQVRAYWCVGIVVSIVTVGLTLGIVGSFLDLPSRNVTILLLPLMSYFIVNRKRYYIEYYKKYKNNKF